MTMTDHDPHIPDDLAAALNRAAAGVPDADLHPSTPTVRLRTRRRRRRTLAATGIAAALVAGVVVTNQALVDERSKVEIDDPAQTAPNDDATPAEVVPIEAGTFSEPIQLEMLWAELQPDLTVRALPEAPPDDAPNGAVRLTDGRVVTLASRDLMPGVEREDGPYVEGVAFVLAVFDAEDRLVQEQDVRIPGESVRIAGEHDGQVVLLRIDGSASDGGTREPVDVSTFDPTTFDETPIATVNLPVQNARTRVAGGTLVSVGETVHSDGSIGGECALTAVDLATGEGQDLAPVPCWNTGVLGVSPDGHLAAVTTEVITGGESGTISLGTTVVDLDRNEVVTSETLGTQPAMCEMTNACTLPTTLATTWTGPDEAMLVLAQDGAIDAANGELDLERLQTHTITVP